MPAETPDIDEGIPMSGYSTSSSEPVIGVEPGRPRVGAAVERELGSGIEVLPEIVETRARQRPWWLHPAFVVSIILTFLTGAGALAFWIVSMVTDDSVKVTNLTIGAEAGNVTLRWDGPDAPYSLYEVSADGAVSDLTQLVRGTTASIFSAAGLFDDGSCFVVRPAVRTGEISLDAATLQSQNGAGVCVADAR